MAEREEGGFSVTIERRAEKRSEAKDQGGTGRVESEKGEAEAALRNLVALATPPVGNDEVGRSALRRPHNQRSLHVHNRCNQHGKDHPE